ncbi:MAG: LptF/LptG family permease [Planctomycetota bacterium]|nr:LptF/LptG family permease [Planctomycetota bacterium]
MTGRALMVGGRLDRYVARLFAASYLAALLLVVGLFLILNMAVDLDEFLEPGDDGTSPSMGLVLRYYALKLPFYYLEMSPFVTLVAGLFTAARLSRQNEVVAVLNAGVSSRRLLAPVFLGATLLAGGMFVLRELATEKLGAERDRIHDYLEHRRPHLITGPLWVRGSAGERVRIDEYVSAPAEEGGPEIRGLSCFRRIGEAAVVIYASVARDPRLADGHWTWQLEGGRQVLVEADQQRPQPLAVFDAVDFGPKDVEMARRGRDQPLELSFAEVHELLARDPTNLQYRMVRQYHLTFPLAGLVLLLVGMPFVMGQERGRNVERIASGLLLCMVYFGTDFVARTLGLQGQIGPLYAAWLPILLFGSLGAVLYAGMRS